LGSLDKALGLGNSRPMDKREFSVSAILAGQAPADLPVTVKGWVRTRRDSRAGISFIHLSDGSSFHPLQVVAPNTLPSYTAAHQRDRCRDAGPLLHFCRSLATHFNPRSVYSIAEPLESKGRSCDAFCHAYGTRLVCYTAVS
jgi:hypothetical protein